MIRNLFGTTADAFALSLHGPVLRHGNGVPSNSLGGNGDLYLRTDGGVSIYMKATGVWTAIDFQEPVAVETVWRGEIINVAGETTIVRVIRNPYTIDTIDITIDSTIVDISATPSSDRTTIHLPTTPEGHGITIKDVTGTAALWEIDIVEPMDGQSSQTLAEDNAVMELMYSGSAWRIVGR